MRSRLFGLGVGFVLLSLSFERQLATGNRTGNRQQATGNRPRNLEPSECPCSNRVPLFRLLPVAYG